MNSELFAIRKYTLNSVGGRFTRPKSRQRFSMRENATNNNKKQTCFQSFYLENRSVRLLHKRLAARDGQPVPYIISFQHSAIFCGTK